MDDGRTLIIVSNGWVDNPHGDTIDSFDEVCRINNAHVVGYEHLVGSKTTIWARWKGDDSPVDFHAEAKRKIGYGYRVDRNEGWEPIPDSVADEIREHVFLETKRVKHATTGLATLVYLLREYPVIHLFNWFPRGEWKPHYWNDLHIPKHQSCCHSHAPELERLYVEMLCDQGRVVLIED